MQEKIKAETVILILTFALVLIVISNIVMLTGVKTQLANKITAAQEAAKPAQLSITTILADSCTDCFNAETLVSGIASLKDATITDQKTLQAGEAADIIKAYSVQKLPAIIVRGEVDLKPSIVSALTQLAAQKIDDGYVINAPGAPYYDIAQQKVIGYLDIIYLLDKTCTTCQNITLFSEQLEQSGIPVKNEARYDRTSPQGANLISKYNIEGVPTLIFKGDVDAYPILIQSWPQIGTVENDGAYVLRTISAPYYSIKDKRIVGDLVLTALVDKTCTTCYDPLQFHKPILAGLGIKPILEKTIDVNSAEGKALLTTYSNISALPTIILTGDTFAYDSLLKGIWPNVGYKANDGAYIFTKAELAQQPYKDLKTGQVVTPQTNENA